MDEDLEKDPAKLKKQIRELKKHFAELVKKAPEQWGLDM
jgi:hypothetical protein